MGSTIDGLEQEFRINRLINEYEDTNENKLVFNTESGIKDEYFEQIKQIHSILLNCVHLDHAQKLYYCNRQRFFMKLYLKELTLIRFKN